MVSFLNHYYNITDFSSDIWYNNSYNVTDWDICLRLPYLGNVGCALNCTDCIDEVFYKVRRGYVMNIVKMAQMLEFAQKGDERGHLVIVEGMQDIPFDIKRIFYIYGSDRDVVRGKHANRKSEFVLINVAGTSKVRVKDGKGNEAVYSLNRSHTGIYLPKMLWKEMYDFSEDSVLLCLSSEHYDAAEYIRDYDEFVGIVNNA